MVPSCIPPDVTLKDSIHLQIMILYFCLLFGWGCATFTRNFGMTIRWANSTFYAYDVLTRVHTRDLYISLRTISSLRHEIYRCFEEPSLRQLEHAWMSKQKDRKQESMEAYSYSISAAVSWSIPLIFISCIKSCGLRKNLWRMGQEER